MIEFVQGNSLHIPFPDGYFQMVCTSPPYYALRDYGTGTWEGGDPNCAHSPARGVGKSTLEGGGKETQGHQKEGYGSVCPKCGAIKTDAQIGLEKSPEEYVNNLVLVFREVWRVLREDGVVFLNIGDSYSGSGGAHANSNNPGISNSFKRDGVPRYGNLGMAHHYSAPKGLKPKDLIGIPWRVAFALQADGWYLRSDIIWQKINPMPESVNDRPTKAHEYVFLLSKSAHYYYDADAIREPYAESLLPRAKRGVSETNKWAEGAPGSTAHSISQPRVNEKKLKDRKDTAFGGDGHSGYMSADGRLLINPLGRNKRTVWSIATQSFRGAHFAVMPEKLVEPCILAGSSEKGACPNCGAPWKRVMKKGYRAPAEEDVISDMIAKGVPRQKANLYGSPSRKPEHYINNPDETIGWIPTCSCGIETTVPCRVLDPFSGAGTVGVVSARYGRDFVGIDLNPEYIEIAKKRLNGTQRKFLP